MIFPLQVIPALGVEGGKANKWDKVIKQRPGFVRTQAFVFLMILILERTDSRGKGAIVYNFSCYVSITGKIACVCKASHWINYYRAKDTRVSCGSNRSSRRNGKCSSNRYFNFTCIATDVDDQHFARHEGVDGHGNVAVTSHGRLVVDRRCGWIDNYRLGIETTIGIGNND